MKDYVKILDFTGHQQNIKINGKDRFQTVFGGILGFLIIILSCSMIITLGLELFLKNEPVLLSSKKKFDNVGPFNITRGGLEIYISMETPGSQYYMDESIYTVSALQVIIETALDSNGNVEQVFNNVPIEVIKCSDYLTKEEIASKQISFPYGLFYCIKPDQAQVQGYWGAPLLKTLKIDITKCQNTTAKSNCKSQEEIDSTIQNGFISAYISDYYLDPKNNTNYIVPYLYDLFQTSSSQNGLVFFVSMQNVQFYDDSGLIFHDYNLIEVPKIQEVKPMYTFGENKRIAQIQLEGNYFGDVYQRSYSKAQDLLTRIGGLIKALTLLGYFINNLYCKALFIVESFNLDHQFVNYSSPSEKPSFTVIKFNRDDISSYSGVNSRPKQSAENLRDEKPTIVKASLVRFSELSLLRKYFCRDKNKDLNINEIYKSYQKFIDKSLSVSTVNRSHFDIQLLKMLLLDNGDIGLMDNAYKNFFDAKNSCLTDFRENMYDVRKEKLFGNVKSSTKEKLKKLNGE
jgi:hypothetical protein